MILDLKELKDACSKILTAIDNNNLSSYSGMLEFKTVDGILNLNITNREYYVSIKLGGCDEDFHATINANLFLKLISQLTTEDVELKTTDTTLIVKANGKYKFPLIYDGEKLLDLPEITILNPTTSFNIESSILNSILVNNSKELSKIPKGNKVAVNQVQKMYYVDEQGAITMYNGACVNKFTLEKPIKLLFNSNLVKLFSLFKNTSVMFTLGYDALSDTIIQTKVQFKTSDIEITAILNCDDSLVKMMPAEVIRARAFNDYPYTVTLNRSALLSTIQRVMLFATDTTSGNYKTCSKFTFTNTCCTISDYAEENVEDITYANEVAADLNYSTMIDLVDIKLALESNNDQYITINFGDHQAIVIAKDNIYTVIPEIN